ncbi:MAG: SDR family oxidoreductase [Bacteroidetes bacterium]|nr:SDR family oxidoreductase [Bacteroidota bacterium]
MILVTGATGFLGATLTRQLVAGGHAVRILRREHSKLDLLNDTANRLEHVIGDVTDYPSVLAAMEGVQHVYHAAAYVGFGGKKDEARLMDVNVRGTANVADAAREAGVMQMVHVSSIAALGRTRGHHEPIDETAEWTASKENSAYAVSKHLAEMEVHRAIAEGLDAVLVNPSLIFGPGRPGENSMAIVEKVRDGRVPGIPSGGTCVVDVEDVAAGIRAAMERGATGERYILGGENLSWANIFGTLAEAFGAKLPRLRLNRGPAMVMATVSETLARLIRVKPLITRETVRAASETYRYSNHRAVEELGCSFRSFRDTADRIAAALSSASEV